MKKLIYLSLLTLLACNKSQNNAPQPQQNTQTINPPPNIVSQQEQMMAGTWKMIISYNYSPPNPAPPVIVTTYTNPIDCRLLLTTTPSTVANTAFPTSKYSESSLYTCMPFKGFWLINEPDILLLDSYEYRIQTLTNDTLVLTGGRAITNYSWKCKFYK